MTTETIQPCPVCGAVPKLAGWSKLYVIDFCEHQCKTNVEDSMWLPRWNAHARERRAERAAIPALKAIQSQCAGHADEFSRRVWEICERALKEAAGE